jgi:hypothetical protein
MSSNRRRRFTQAVSRGRRFEAEERAGWSHIPRDQIGFEASTHWEGRRGRIDILIRDEDGSVAIAEVKATDWDRIRPHRIRPTALRHARQIWRYIEDHNTTQNRSVSPALVYEYPPRRQGVRAQVEQLLNDRFIQVVWRKDTPARQ